MVGDILTFSFALVGAMCAHLSFCICPGGGHLPFFSFAPAWARSGMALINIICERVAHLAQIPLLKFLVNNMHHSLRNYRLLDLCRNEQFTTRCIGQETLRSNLATNFQERLDNVSIWNSILANATFPFFTMEPWLDGEPHLIAFLDLELNPCQCNLFLFYDGTLLHLRIYRGLVIAPPIFFLAQNRHVWPLCNTY